MPNARKQVKKKPTKKQTTPKQPTTAVVRKRDPSKAPKNTPLKNIITQLSLGATQAQVAKSANVSRAAITQTLKRYGIERNMLESFKQNRADIMAGIQETVAASLTEDDIKKASVRDKTILFGTLYDKERLERGQSTSNQSIMLRAIMDTVGEGKE